MLAAGDGEHAGLSLPAVLLKRTRCDSPGAADAHAPDGAAGRDGGDDSGAPAADHVLSVREAEGAAAAQHAASPPPGGKSPPRGANKSPRWRAHGTAASSPLGEAARSAQSGRGAADALAPAAASPASGADASPPRRDGEARAASAGGGTEKNGEQRRGGAGAPRASHCAAAVPVFYGAFAARGARPYMEDRHVIVTPFAGEPGAEQTEPSTACTFVGVYDGHNGAFAAEHAANHLHTLLAADPALASRPPGDAGVAQPAAGAAAAPVAQPPPPSSDGAVADALVRAFLAVDSQILVASAAGGTREGATALVALRLGGALYTAHAGDSRGVAAVGGRAVRLTRDHTPACAHEAARVRSRGGQLEFAGCWRVVAPPPRGPPRPRAALAVTRALGDLSFKHPTPVITAQPDVGRLELTPEVAFVVLATDGLWDVLTDQDAVDIGLAALTARRRPGGGGHASERAARAVASTLVNTALMRGSSDNITAVVLLMGW